MNYYNRLKELTLFKILNYGTNLFLNRILGFIFLSLLTKYFDQSIIGQYLIFINLQTILVSASLMGIPHLIVKELSDNLNNRISFFFKYKVLLFCFLSSFFALFFFFVLTNIYYKTIEYKYLIFLSCTFTILNLIFFYFFISIKKIILGNFLEQILKYILLIIFLFLLLFLNVSFEILHLISLYCVVNIIIFFISAYFFYNKDNFFSEKNDLNIKYKEYLKYIYSTGLISLVTILNSKIDILLIKYFLDEIQVSIYGIGAQLSFIMNIPLIVILHILMPKIASLIRRKKQMQLNILSDFYRFILVILCVLIIVALSFFYSDIIKIFFSKNYLESYNVFMIIALSYLITSFFSLNDLFFIYAGKEKKILIYMFLSFLTNIFLSLILIRDYGIVGSAVALSLSNILFSFLIFISNIKNNYLFKYVFRMIFENKLWLIKKL